MDLVRTACLAFVITASLIPILAWYSNRVGLVDLPNERKLHSGRVPLVGGLAIYCGMVIALLTSGFLDRQVLLLLTASLALIIIGVLDDRLDLHSSYRLVVQVSAAATLYYAGVHFQLFGIAGLDALITILWIVGIVNAFNCLDCADGMAGISALIAFTYFAVAAADAGRNFVAQIAIAGAAGALAFLFYNRPKARVFMGDTGSTFLGLTLAGLAILASPREPAPLHLPWPALALAVPTYDLVLVHVRRYRGGVRSVRNLLASTGKDHLPHRLLLCGQTPWRSLATMALLAALAGTAARLLEAREWLAGLCFLTLLGFLLMAIERRYTLTLSTVYRRSDPRPKLTTEPVRVDPAA